MPATANGCGALEIVRRLYVQILVLVNAASQLDGIEVRESSHLDAALRKMQAPALLSDELVSTTQ